MYIQFSYHANCDFSAVFAATIDLATGREFTASSTCGLNGPQLYCSIYDTTSPEDDNGNGGRDCFTCDDTDPINSHSPRLLSDLDSNSTTTTTTGNNNITWWQAENGVENVTLELKLNALFTFSHLVMTFRSPRPATAVIERSRDFGLTYEPYQYYSNDCMSDFGMPDESTITTIDGVICTSNYTSLEPLTDGKVYIYTYS